MTQTSISCRSDLGETGSATIIPAGGVSMAKLDNPRWERFAELTATGSKRGDAYLAAGYTAKTR